MDVCTMFWFTISYVQLISLNMYFTLVLHGRMQFILLHDGICIAFSIGDTRMLHACIYYLRMYLRTYEDIYVLSFVINNNI